MRPMNGNPKSDIRHPKEIRSPKSKRMGLEGSSGEDSAFWSWGDKTVADAVELKEDGKPAPTPPRDLMERAARFGEAIIGFAKRIPQGPVTNRLIDQLVGAGTSVAANYCEADDSGFRQGLQEEHRNVPQRIQAVDALSAADRESRGKPDTRSPQPLARGQRAESDLRLDLEEMNMPPQNASFGLRVSGFGFLSDFGLRASDFTAAS
jgi:hypothetical protein